MLNKIKYALASVSAVLGSSAGAQTPVEALPDHIERRIRSDEVHDAVGKLVQQGDIQQGVVTRAKRWNTSDPVRVCFFGGTTALRTRIMNIANQWTTGSPLRFDWGNPANPRLCGSEFAQIRVGYSPTGYWSLIGQDSIVYAGQYEQSLNLGMFDFNPPAEPEFTAVVLHEFGHALGFQHEHQHPIESCESEFNWPVVYQYLAGAPNYWNKEKVDHNMRSRPYFEGDTITTGFDRQSIMLYTFPSQFYLQGVNSRCFAGKNTTLSQRDRQTFLAAYNNNANALAALATAANRLPPGERALLADRLSFFRLTNRESAAVVKRLEGDVATPVFGEHIRDMLAAQAANR